MKALSARIAGRWTWLWAFPLLAVAASADVGFPATSLHLTVTIDGSDELHLSHRSATWVHKSWSPPTEVLINGLKWNPQQRPVLVATNSALLVPGLDLCGAVLHTLRGRGTVELGREAAGLVIRFDDPENGADTYEVELDFAQAIAQNRPVPTNSLELRLAATIDGMDEVWLSQDQGKWVHSEWHAPTEVTANGQPWDVGKHPLLALQPALSPETMDLQRATLTRLHGRGTSNLEVYRPGVLCLDFEDPENGADRYEVVVRVPPFGRRHLVRVKAEVPDLLLGAPLRIYRFPAPEDVYALVPGQRVFDARGQCLVALEAGQYEFEVLHQAGPQLLVALRTGVLSVTGPTNIDLKVQRVEPGLYGPQGQPMRLDDLLLRSTRPCGAVSWKRGPGAASAPPALLLSEGQSYKLHAFGQAGSDYAALWRTASASEVAKLTLEPGQWLPCSFSWKEGTPAAEARGVVLRFPDGQLEIPQADSARFFSNRRFFEVGYWLAFAAERKAVFQPRGLVLSLDGGEAPGGDSRPGAMNEPGSWRNEGRHTVLPLPSGEDRGEGGHRGSPGRQNLPDAVRGQVVLLGGPLRPVASAAILQDEGLHPRDALHLWWEITLADSQNFLLGTNASKIDWTPAITTRDGQPAPIAPLLAPDVRRLGNLQETLMASATYDLGGVQRVSLAPQVFVSRESAHCFTQVPSYRDWNTRAYLAKAERELKFIARARARSLSAGQRFQVKWWFNNGAVGGGDSVTMPFLGYLECRDWFAHPWAIAHELMHNLGYGHTHEMDRLDREVQARMAQFQCDVADHPEFVPEDGELTPGP